MDGRLANLGFALLGAIAFLSAKASAQDASGAMTIPSSPAAVLLEQGFIDQAVSECEDGRPATLRFNRARSGATFAEFAQAFKAHEAWVHGKGHDDVEFVLLSASNALDDDGDFIFGGMLVYPSIARLTEVMANRAQERNEEAYQAFIAQYQATTDSVQTLYACLR